MCDGNDNYLNIHLITFSYHGEQIDCENRNLQFVDSYKVELQENNQNNDMTWGWKPSNQPG